MQISNAPETIPQCQYVLEHSQVPYAQLVMANALRKLVTQNWNNSTSPQRLEMRTWVLSYLANSGPTVAPFVISSLVQLLCRITKMGWFEDPAHQSITDEVCKYL
jgi:exportin-7